MMIKVIKFILATIGAIVILVVLARVLSGGEDDWMCADGQWVKHGFPSAPKPEGPCTMKDNFNPFK